jgi:hypothetical protein
LWALGIVLLILWAVWWIGSFITRPIIAPAPAGAEGQVRLHALLDGRRTWILPAKFIGKDLHYNYVSVRSWLAGYHPYRHAPDEPDRPLYIYPPPALPLFAWTALMALDAAIVLWTCALVGIMAIGARMSWRERVTARLSPTLPFVLVLGLVLLSTPVVFLMERGNFDGVVVLLLVCAVALMRPETAKADALAGLCVALAAWLKVYPGIVLLGLCALRRWRVLAWAVAWGIGLGLAMWPATLAWIESIRAAAQHAGTIGDAGDARYATWSHTLPAWWDFLRTSRRTLLPQVPGIVVAAIVLLPLAAWVCWSVYRSDRRATVVFGLLAWLTALGTFAPAISFDYNLIFLPLAALAVWDRRDPVIAQAVLVLLMLWWQPFNLGIDGAFLSLVKLLGLVAVGYLIVRRARSDELDPARGEHHHPEQQPAVAES